MSNREAARMLFAVAALLESEGANLYRVRAYRRAAAALLAVPHDATLHLGPASELHLPGLGPRLRRKLGELLTTGRMRFYDDVIEALPPAKRELLSIPGVGPKTAQQLQEVLHLATVQAVADAAQVGLLRRLPGIGERRERQLGVAATEVLRKAA